RRARLPLRRGRWARRRRSGTTSRSLPPARAARRPAAACTATAGQESLFSWQNLLSRWNVYKQYNIFGVQWQYFLADPQAPREMQRQKRPRLEKAGAAQTVKNPRGERERAEALSRFNRPRRRVRRGRGDFCGGKSHFPEQKSFP